MGVWVGGLGRGEEGGCTGLGGQRHSRTDRRQRQRENSQGHTAFSVCVCVTPIVAPLCGFTSSVWGCVFYMVQPCASPVIITVCKMGVTIIFYYTNDACTCYFIKINLHTVWLRF